MYNNRKLIITLIIVITILVIALAGVIIFFALQEENSKGEEMESSNIEESTNTEDEEIDRELEEEIEGEEETDDLLHDVATQLERMELETFNSKFTGYEGIQSASQIKALIDMIEANNNNQLEHQIILDNTGIISKEQVVVEKKYNVELAYGDEGYVNLIKIVESNGGEVEDTTQGNNEQEDSEQQTTTSDMDKLLFNSKLTSYLGNITGEQVNNLLQACQEAVNTNPDHTIDIKGQGFTELVTTDIYTVTFDYDDTGYINTININKKM